jgi:hypothetical protein
LLLVAIAQERYTLRLGLVALASSTPFLAFSGEQIFEAWAWSPERVERREREVAAQTTQHARA